MTPEEKLKEISLHLHNWLTFNAAGWKALDFEPSDDVTLIPPDMTRRQVKAWISALEEGQRTIREAIAEEREAIAKEIEITDDGGTGWAGEAARNMESEIRASIAAAIRARGQKQEEPA